MDSQTEQPPPSGSRSSIAVKAAVAVVGAALVGAMIFSGLGVASGQSDRPPSADKGPLGHKVMGKGKFGHGPMGFGRMIHGEATFKKDAGTFQTVAHQTGEVTAVSTSEIKVKSEDGFSREYKVGDKTRVNRDGKIEDIKQGAKVHIMATVTGGKATAIRVMDSAKMEEFKQQRKAHRAERKEHLMDGLPRP